jgi:AcrR family transcriptional regulator
MGRIAKSARYFALVLAGAQTTMSEIAKSAGLNRESL